MENKDEITIPSKLVLKQWFILWKEVKHDTSAEDWNRDKLVDLIVADCMASIPLTADKSKQCREAVEERLSQSFRYARNNLIEAYVEREIGLSKDGDEQVAKNKVLQSFKERLGLKTLTIAVSLKPKGGVKCGKVNNWGLPPSSKSKGKASIDWVGEFDGLF